MPPQLPSGARFLSLPQIAPTGGSGQIRDISSEYWFSALQPVVPVAPSSLRPRQWQYQPGANTIWTPGTENTSGDNFWVLREVADSWDMLRVILETVKDRICSQKIDFRLIRDKNENQKTYKTRNSDDPRLAALKTFFKYPDGVHPWREWLRMWLEDVLVLDAAAIYLERDKKGRVASLRPIDGATITRCITDQGFIPQGPDDVAYQQVLYGLPAINLTMSDLVYVMRNPRTWRRYGFSPVEQMLVTIGIGIRKQSFDSKYFSEGNIPEALCFLPPDLSIDKVQEIQGWYDSILSGNLTNRRRLTFLPGYGSSKDQSFRPNIIFPKENALKNPLDEWLFQICCYALGTTPSAMLKNLNRATSQQNSETAEEEGLAPKLRSIEDTINYIVQSEVGFGFNDIEASFQTPPETDAEKQMTVDTGYVKNAVMTINEVREDKGLDPLPEAEANLPGVMTQNGFVPLSQRVDMSAAPGGGGQPGGGGNPAKPASSQPAQKAHLLKGSAPKLDPTHSTPVTRHAQMQIYDAIKKVFRRQKERATQTATELLKKKLLITKNFFKTQFKNYSTQVNVPTALAAEILERSQQLIPDLDLAGKGREFEPHVTVKYGVSPNLQALQLVLSHFQPFTVTLGRTNVFPVSEHSEGTSPVVVEVDAPELRQLHDEIGAVIGVKPDSFPYHPHLTLAYVKPEDADKYQGLYSFEGKTFTVDAVVLTDTEGEQLPVPLGKLDKSVGWKLLWTGPFASGGLVDKDGVEISKADDGLSEDDVTNQINDVVSQEWQQLPTQVRQALLDAFTAGISKGIMELGVGDADLIGQMNRTAFDWAVDRAAELVGMKYDVDGNLIPNPDAQWAISDTTRAQIRQIVADAFTDETALQDLADSIQNAGAFSDSRALMIAKTEATRAQVAGNFDSWSQSGLVKKLTWTMSSDHDIDDECNGNDGVEVDLGDAFPSGDSFPPAHPNCECSVYASSIEGIN